jgi:hypothetical protein
MEIALKVSTGNGWDFLVVGGETLHNCAVISS